MFVVGVVPALLVLYIRTHVPESPAWEAQRERRETILTALKGRWGLFIYVVVLMTAFNFFSHGTQYLYPTFLEVQHHLSTHTVGIIAIVYNIGALIGGIVAVAVAVLAWFGRERKGVSFIALETMPEPARSTL